MASSSGKKGGRPSTLAFRLINPELFIKPVSILSLIIRFLIHVNFDVDRVRSLLSQHQKLGQFLGFFFS